MSGDTPTCAATEFGHTCTHTSAVIHTGSHTLPSPPSRTHTYLVLEGRSITRLLLGLLLRPVLVILLALAKHLGENKFLYIHGGGGNVGRGGLSKTRKDDGEVTHA